MKQYHGLMALQIHLMGFCRVGKIPMLNNMVGVRLENGKYSTLNLFFELA